MKLHKLYKNWTVHNMVAHPLMHILNTVKCNKLAEKVHNGTLPEA